MALIACDQHEDHERAHADPSVRRAAQLLAMWSRPEVLAAAISLLIAEGAAAQKLFAARERGIQASTLPEEAQRELIELMACCLAIATFPSGHPADPVRIRQRRGALLEAFVALLVEERASRVGIEQRLRFGSYESRCVDVVAVNDETAPDYECVECKTYPPDLEESFLDAFNALPDAVAVHGYSAVVGVATLQTRTLLDAVLGLRHPGIRRISQETILSLKRYPITHLMFQAA